MAIRRSNDVFLLTLVDFLIQIIFFSLFVFVVYQALINDPNAKNYDNAQVTKTIEAAGVSNLTELTDELTKLAPVSLKGFNEALGKDVRPGDIEEAAKAINKAGGAEKLGAAVERLAKLELGSNKPACIYTVENGEKTTTTLATAVGSATSITFTSNTPELATLLSSIGLRYDDVKSLSLSRFKQVLAPVLRNQPDCRYTIVLRETTRLVNARDAAGQIFYLRIRR